MSKDTYHESCHCYLDDKNSSWYATLLLSSAIDHFKKQYKIKKYDDYRKVILAHDKDVVLFNKNRELWNLLFEFVREELIDSVRIVICFENYMKSVLLRKKYLIHEIEHRDQTKLKTLSMKQKTEPVSIEEFRKLDSIKYDDVTGENLFSAIKREKTLPVWKLLNEVKYKEVIDLPNEIHHFVMAHVNKRNSFHFLTEGNSASCGKGRLDEMMQLAKFVDDRIIESLNSWCVDNGRGDMKEAKIIGSLIKDTDGAI